MQSTLIFEQQKTKRDVMNRERREMLEVIGPYDSITHQNTAVRLRQPETSLWFTEGPDFQHWLSTKNTNVWLYGIPGAGKTILAGSAMSGATEKASTKTSVGFFYYDYKDSRTQDLMIILGSLIRLFALKNEQSLEKVESLYQAHSSKSRSTAISVSQLSTLTLKIIALSGALDECGIRRFDLVVALASLSTGSTIKTLFTSRLESDIERYLSYFCKASITATSQELKLYVASEVNPQSQDNELLTLNPEVTQETYERILD